MELIVNEIRIDIDIKIYTFHCCLSPIYSPNSMGMMNMNHKSKKDPLLWDARRASLGTKTKRSRLSRCSYFLFYPNPVVRDLIPLIEFN